MQAPSALLIHWRSECRVTLPVRNGRTVLCSLNKSEDEIDVETDHSYSTFVDGGEGGH